MPSEVLNHGRVPSPYAPSLSSSFFSEEIRFPDENKVGFWKHDSRSDKHGTEAALFASKSETVPLPYTKKAQLVGLDSITGLESNHVTFVKEKKIGFNVDGFVASSKEVSHDLETQTNLFVESGSLPPKESSTKLNDTYYENGLFSGSLSELFNKQMTVSNNALFGNSIDIDNTNIKEYDETFESLEEIEAQTIGDLLPDDDDLLFGAVDDSDFTTQQDSNGDIEDDLFNSGGGMELDVDNISDDDQGFDLSNRGSHLYQQGELNSFAGEQSYGEHPSRTLFVRNISSNVEDAELTTLFKQYGDIHTMYTACKHRGFVMISYYDIRSARNAMEALQKKSLRQRKLGIHFSIPKDNPSDKDVNQGILIVTDLDSSVSNDDLLQKFSAYGEVKEIRETSHKHHKVIEFYDVRAAEAALIVLDRNIISGKEIKLKSVHPQGSLSLIQQIHPELDHGKVGGCDQQGSSPIIHTLKTMTSSAHNNCAKQDSQSQISSLLDDSLNGTSCNPLHNSSSASRSVSGCSNQSRNVEIGHSIGQGNFGSQNALNFSPHSFPKLDDNFLYGIRNKCPSTMPSTAIDIARPAGICNVIVSGVNGQSFEHNRGGLGYSRNGRCPLHEHHYPWNDSNPCAPGHGKWPNSPSFVNDNPCRPLSQLHALPRTSSSVINNVMHLPHYHGCSAPTVNHSFWETHHAYRGEMTGASIFCPGSFGNTGFSGSSMLHPLELSSDIFPFVGGNFMDPSMSPLHTGSPFQHKNYVFHGRNPRIQMHAAFGDRARGRRSDITSNHADNKKQYDLDIDRIISGEDARTTLMIKNIPNKYTSKMLLDTIDEYHRGTYDFIYLPIDFKNKCNVGYAFINMIEPKQIIPFYKTFNGKKWERFNSEKVASLAYARIQGKAALIAHFQNSSLMNEDKQCRPILFHSDGPHAGDQEPFPVGVNTRHRFGRSKTLYDEDGQQGSPSNSAVAEETSKVDSSSGPTKNFE